MPGILAILGSTLGCAGGQEVNPKAIDAARRLWTQAGIRDYNLEWSVTGPNNAHYFVSVQGGEVRKVESVQPDGARFVLKPPEPRFFSVDGLFLTIADELALLKTDRPFGQAKGTKVVMRFEPDPQRGYPHWYRRDVMGTSQSMRIDVIGLVPKAATSKSLDH
jgi:Family of unknown function (DUF6174)